MKKLILLILLISSNCFSASYGDYSYCNQDGTIVEPLLEAAYLRKDLTENIENINEDYKNNGTDIWDDVYYDNSYSVGDSIRSGSWYTLLYSDLNGFLVPNRFDYNDDGYVSYDEMDGDFKLFAFEAKKEIVPLGKPLPILLTLIILYLIWKKRK